MTIATTWDNKLSDKNSTEYKELKQEVERAVSELLFYSGMHPRKCLTSKIHETSYTHLTLVHATYTLLEIFFSFFVVARRNFSHQWNRTNREHHFQVFTTVNNRSKLFHTFLSSSPAKMLQSFLFTLTSYRVDG